MTQGGASCVIAVIPCHPRESGEKAGIQRFGSGCAGLGVGSSAFRGVPRQCSTGRCSRTMLRDSHRQACPAAGGTSTPSVVHPECRPPRASSTPSVVHPERRPPRASSTPSVVHPERRPPRTSSAPSVVRPERRPPRASSTPSVVHPERRPPRASSTPRVVHRGVRRSGTVNPVGKGFESLVREVFDRTAKNRSPTGFRFRDARVRQAPPPGRAEPGFTTGVW